MINQKNENQKKNVGFIKKTIKEFIITLDDLKGRNNIDEPIYQKNNLRRISIFGFPALLSALLIAFGFFVSIDVDNGLLIAFSIFTTLLFNFLLLMHNFSYSKSENTEANEELEKLNFFIYKTAFKHSLSELRFGILISVFDLIFLIVYQWMYPVTFLHPIFSGVIYYLTILFIIVFFRILKDVFTFSSYYQNKMIK